MSENQQLMDWDSLRMGLIFCYDGTVRDQGIGELYVSSSTAWLVKKGWAKITDSEGIVTRAYSGQWLMGKPGKREQIFSKEIELLSINFQAILHTGENLFNEGLSVVLEAKEFPELEKRANRLVQTSTKVLGVDQIRWAVSAPTNLKEYLLVQRAILDWIMSWNEALLTVGLQPCSAFGKEPRVKEAINFLYGHLKDPELDGSSVARSVGLSLSQLNRQFLRERGETLRQCHQALRFEHSRNMLAHSQLSFKEISTELGFRHQSHFTAWFKKNSGITPTRFRSDPSLSRYFDPKSA